MVCKEDIEDVLNERIHHHFDDLTGMMPMILIICGSFDQDEIFIVTIYPQWHAGNVACKILMMIRTGGYILSSLMLIVLSVDR